MLDSDQLRDEIEAYAHQHFDSGFNEKLLKKLLDHSYQVSSTLAESFDLLFNSPPDKTADDDSLPETL